MRHLQDALCLLACAAFLASCSRKPDKPAPAPTGQLLTVVAMSDVPDPAKAPYKSCLVHFVAEQSDGERVNAIAWAFRDRKLSPAGTFRPGDVLDANLRPFAEMPEALKREMAASDASDLDLSNLWVETLHLVNGKPPTARTNKADKPSGGLSKTVARIHRVLAAHGESKIGHNGANDWFFLLNFPDLHSPDYLVPTEAERRDLSGPLPAIVDFKNELAKHDVGLVLVIAPLKAHQFPGYATNLPYDMATDGRVDLATQRLIGALRDEGVHAIDCLPLLDEHRWEEYAPGKFTPIYSPYHHHWSSLGSKLIAEEVVATARKANIAPSSTPTAPPISTQEVAPPPEKYLTESPRPGRKRERFDESFWVAPETTEHPDGPEVILLGDSFSYLWEHRRASFHDHLSAGFGQSVAKIIANGSSATYTRQQLARAWGDYKNLKLVIWEVSEAYLADKRLWQPVKLDGWVDLVRHLDKAEPTGGKIEPITDQAILRHRSAGLAFNASANSVRLKWAGVKLGKAPKLVTALCHPLVDGAPDSDGVTFAVYVDGDRAGHRSIRPPTKAKPSSFAKQWAVPLAEFAGRTVELELVVEPRDHADGDRGIWIEPTLLDATLPEQ